MSELVRYRDPIMDSDRWKGFTFRDGDIVISTPAKCGTTWMQTVCALLIFRSTDFGKPLDLVSPWLEQSIRPLDAVVADLDAQTHRRFIKSHTPADGLPWDDRVTYLCIARDPRDVALSWDHHFHNVDMDAFFELRAKAVGNADLAELMPDGPPKPGPTVEARFWEWVEKEDSGPRRGLRATLQHVKSFWDLRERPNVILLHYGDLKADLEGQMRGLANRLGIAVPEAAWPDLVKAAGFEEMRNRASAIGPNQTENIWKNPTDFFHKGANGQWRELLDDEGQRRYAARAMQLADPELLAWVHREPLARLQA